MTDPNVVIIFFNFGPYHISRIANFAKLFDGGIFPIQLFQRDEKRDWVIDQCDIQIITIRDKSIENSSSLVAALIKQLSIINPDIVVIAGYGHELMRAAAKWSRKNKVLTVLMSDSQEVDKSRIWFKEKIKGWWIKKHFDAAFVSGMRASEYLQGLGFSDNLIWRGYDVVDNDYFIRKTAEIKKTKEVYRKKLGLPERYFIYVGRFSPEKNLFRLLEAYKKYINIIQENAWGLVMVGSGPQDKNLKEHAEKLGLDKILWTGFKQINELPSYYGLASCIILPSSSETWGLPVNEAMASGLPVLVSNICGCVPELVYPGLNGYSFDPHNIHEIAYYMERMSSDEIDIESMGSASMKIISNYNTETWALALKDCIQVTMLGKFK